MLLKNRQIFIVIPVHNRREVTLACLHQLGTQTYHKLRIVVVDDGSTDGTDEAIKREFPETVLLKGDGHLWWSGAMNEGVRWTLKHCEIEQDLLLSLNDDVIIDNDYVSSLVEAYETIGPNSILGSVSLDSKNKRIVDCGVEIDYRSAKFLFKHCGNDFSTVSELSNNKIINTDAVSGRGTLIPLKAFTEIGLYNNEMLPHYAGDYEFSIRAGNNGYKLFISLTSKLYSLKEFTGLNPTFRKISWLEFMNSFISIRSSTSIRYRINFARLVVPKKLFLRYILLDISRVIAGNIMRQIGLRPTR